MAHIALYIRSAIGSCRCVWRINLCTVHPAIMWSIGYAPVVLVLQYQHFSFLIHSDKEVFLMNLKAICLCYPNEWWLWDILPLRDLHYSFVRGAFFFPLRSLFVRCDHHNPWICLFVGIWPQLCYDSHGAALGLKYWHPCYNMVTSLTIRLRTTHSTPRHGKNIPSSIAIFCQLSRKNLIPCPPPQRLADYTVSVQRRLGMSSLSGNVFRTTVSRLGTALRH